MLWGFFYSNEFESQLISYAYAGYLSDSHKAHSQTGYLFTCGRHNYTVALYKINFGCYFSNHSEIIAMHETSRWYVWLKLLTQHIQKIYGLTLEEKIITILYEKNAACIAQLKGGYIKEDRTKHISLNFFTKIIFYS